MEKKIKFNVISGNEMDEWEKRMYGAIDVYNQILSYYDKEAKKNPHKIINDQMFGKCTVNKLIEKYIYHMALTIDIMTGAEVLKKCYSFFANYKLDKLADYISDYVVNDLDLLCDEKTKILCIGNQIEIAKNIQNEITKHGDLYEAIKKKIAG